MPVAPRAPAPSSPRGVGGSGEGPAAARRPGGGPAAAVPAAPRTVDQASVTACAAARVSARTVSSADNSPGRPPPSGRGARPPSAARAVSPSRTNGEPRSSATARFGAAWPAAVWSGAGGVAGAGCGDRRAQFGAWPSVQSAAQVRRRAGRPASRGEDVATERWGRSRRVSSTKPGRLPGPSATKLRTPASSYSRSVSSLKRTGSRRCRTTSSRTASASAGNGASVVADHTATAPSRTGSRSNAERTCPRYGSHIGVWKPERNGSSCPSTPSERSRSRTRPTPAGSPQTTDWCGQLSWLTTTPATPCNAASARAAPHPSAA